MSYKIMVTFAEGVTPDDLVRANKRMGVTPDRIPEGNMSHTEAVVDGQLVYNEEWTSKAVFDAFIQEVAAPVLKAEGIEIAEVEEL